VKRFLLDTSILSAYLQGRPGVVSLVEPWVLRDEAATSIVVYGEVFEFISGQTTFDAYRRELRRLLRRSPPVLLTKSIVERYAVIRRQLRPPYGPGLIGDIDTLIAATAIEKSLTLVTTDSDFSRVPGLALQLIPRQNLRT
jgi:predicted nucleic acid-binding protein